MSRVLVDRELLEKWADKLEGADSAGYGWEDLLATEVRGVIAQPAEAEGVDFGFDDRSVKVSQEAYSIFLEREQHRLAALSAVTAERDRLDAECGRLLEGNVQDAETIFELEAERDQYRAEAEALRVALFGIASANPAERGIEWAKAYASDGLSGTGSELYNRWLETFKEAEALRKDAERYRMFRRGMFDPDQFDADIDAALAAQGGAADE